MTSKAKRILYPLQIQRKVHFQMTISQIGILSDISLDGAQTAAHQFSNERKTSTVLFQGNYRGGWEENCKIQKNNNSGSWGVVVL